MIEDESLTKFTPHSALTLAYGSGEETATLFINHVIKGSVFIQFNDKTSTSLFSQGGYLLKFEQRHSMLALPWAAPLRCSLHKKGDRENRE